MSYLVSQGWGDEFSGNVWSLCDGVVRIKALRPSDTHVLWTLEPIPPTAEFYRFKYPYEFFTANDSWDLAPFLLRAGRCGAYIGALHDGSLASVGTADEATTFLKTQGLPPTSCEHCTLFAQNDASVLPVGYDGTTVKVGALMPPDSLAWTWFTTTFIETNIAERDKQEQWP